MEAAHNCPEMEEHRHLQILALSVWFSKFTFLFRDGVGCAAEEMTDHVPMLRKGSARTDCNCTFPSADTRGSEQCPGRQHLKVRGFSKEEMYHYNRGCIGHECIPFANCLGSLVPWSVAGASLKVWPRFFTSVDESGKGLREALASKWTSYIVLESIFAALAVTPLVQIPTQVQDSWRFEVYGVLWMVALVSDLITLGITVICMSYLNAIPAKLTYIWLCKTGPLTNVPAFFAFVTSVVGFTAIAFTSWTVYGLRTLFGCLALELFAILYVSTTFIVLSVACQETLDLI